MIIIIGTIAVTIMIIMLTRDMVITLTILLIVFIITLTVPGIIRIAPWCIIKTRLFILEQTINPISQLTGIIFTVTVIFRFKMAEMQEPILLHILRIPILQNPQELLIAAAAIMQAEEAAGLKVLEAVQAPQGRPGVVEGGTDIWL